MNNQFLNITPSQDPINQLTEDPGLSQQQARFKNEFGGSMKKNMQYDNKTPLDIIRSASSKTGVSPQLLLASAWQEGMNKAAIHPDLVSEAYNNAYDKRPNDSRNYPVDGFYNYGLDTFGNNYNNIKKYLPSDFNGRFQLYNAKNEKGETVSTAAFKTNEDALIAKSAMMKYSTEQLNDYAKKKGVSIDPKDLDYFTLAAYNGGLTNAKTMIDEYSKSKDKTSFVKNGETTRKGVHKNIMPRLENMNIANDFLNQK